jgi:hypothetical protein
MNEPSRTRTPGSSAEVAQPSAIRHVTMNGSGNSSRRKPKPGIWIVKPQLAGLSSRISTSSKSPGSAPLTNTGPVSGCTTLMSTLSRSAAAVDAVTWPSSASLVSSSTSSPGGFERGRDVGVPAIVALRGLRGASNAIVKLEAFHRLCRLSIYAARCAATVALNREIPSFAELTPGTSQCGQLWVCPGQFSAQRSIRPSVPLILT